jgi:hypothetical protein
MNQRAQELQLAGLVQARRRHMLHGVDAERAVAAGSFEQTREAPAYVEQGRADGKLASPSTETGDAARQPNAGECGR